MSRNLTTSKCCDNVVRLSDLRGKPVEFRRYFSSAPHMGVRWDCPTCATAYFTVWREYLEYEVRPGGRATSVFVIDLSYYESFNDEHDDPIDLDNPRHLCTDDALDAQWVW